MASSRLLKILKAALGQGEKGRRSGKAFRNPKTGRLEGISKKDLKTASKLRKGAIAAGVGAGGLAAANLVNKKDPKRMTSQEAKERREIQPPEPKALASEPKIQAPKPSKLVEREVPTAAVDKLKSVSRAMSPSQEATERRDIEMVKKSPEKFLGLFEMDEKQQSMEDFLKEMSSINKAGGSIRKKKMKKGGSVKVRKANCKRGQGKALRGY